MRKKMGNLQNVKNRLTPIQAREIDCLLTPSLLRQCYIIAIRTTGNREDAQELVQEACMKACHAFQGFCEAKASFSTWLIGIVQTLCLDYIVRKERLPVVSIDWLTSLDPKNPLQLVDKSPRFEEVVYHKEVCQELENVFPQQMQLLRLLELYGYTYKETAVILGCKESILAGKVSRVKKELREYLRWRVAIGAL